MPGIPQVYYVGLLAGANDMALLARTGVGRDINRHHYTRQQVAQVPQRGVVQRLLALILRNRHAAFNGAFSFDADLPHTLCLRWVHGTRTATLQPNFDDLSHELNFDGVDGPQQLSF